jgi:hypothetical protein
MTPAEIRDRLPLLAGGDLEAEEAAEVRAAFAGDEALAREGAAYDELETLLSDAFAVEACAVETGGLPEASEAPAWLSAAFETPSDSAGADAALDVAHDDAPVEHVEDSMPLATDPKTVVRRCPYCHDGMLAEEGTVFCAACATPHHAECFSDHGGCSLLGCESKRSVDTSASASRLVCPTCKGLSPSEAPFCAWCGHGLGEGSEEAAPQRFAAPAMALRSYLMAAGLVLSAALGLGGYFGLQQSHLTVRLTELAVRQERTSVEQSAQDMLRALVRAQRVFRDDDLDRNGMPNLAPDLKVLRQAFDSKSELGQTLERLGWNQAYEFRLEIEGETFAVCAVPGARARGLGIQSGFMCDAAGRIHTLEIADQGQFDVHQALKLKCGECHSDPHHVIFPDPQRARHECSECHEVKAWSPAKGVVPSRRER